MDCTVLLDKSGSGKGSFDAVGSVRSPGTLELTSFDPNGCYNILCKTSDTALSTRIDWDGSFTNDRSSDGDFTSFGVPFYLSGSELGTGCTKLAPSCEQLDITAQSARAAPENADLSEYSCAKVNFTCKPETGCPKPQYELRCVESVNPSGKHIPTAGTSLDPKVSPHQNPDGFYTFGFVNTCGEPVCIAGLPVRLYSGLGPNGEMDKLVEYPGDIKNLRDDPRGYQSCDTVKYTQFANDKKNTEKKIGSEPDNVRAHLQGSGDMVVKAVDPNGVEQVAFCRVPKPPARA